jgi:hypothetical protein
MYNQKPPSRPTDSGFGNGSGSKFQNKNIGNSYKAPPGKMFTYVLDTAGLLTDADFSSKAEQRGLLLA